jgi:hypothetical protein
MIRNVSAVNIYYSPLSSVRGTDSSRRALISVSVDLFTEIGVVFFDGLGVKIVTKGVNLCGNLYWRVCGAFTTPSLCLIISVAFY